MGSEKEQKVKQLESNTKELEKSLEKSKEEIKEFKEFDVFLKNPDIGDGEKIKKLRKNYQEAMEKAGKMEEKYRTAKREWEDTNMKLVQMTTNYESSKVKISNLQAELKTKKEVSNENIINTQREKIAKILAEITSLKKQLESENERAENFKKMALDVIE